MRAIAVYSLVQYACYEPIIQEICDECNRDLENGVVGIRPVVLQNQFMFVGRPLQEVAEFHCQLIRESDWVRLYFVVVHWEEWNARGVLVVTLDSDGHGRPDCFSIAAADAARIVGELQDGSMSWADAVKDFDLEGGSGSDGADDDDDDDEDDDADFEDALRSPRPRGWREG